MDELIGAVIGVISIEIGRLAVRVFSLGRWRGEARLGDESRVFGAAGALSFVRDGQRVVTDTGLLFAGIAVLVVVIGAITVICLNT